MNWLQKSIKNLIFKDFDFSSEGNFYPVNREFLGSNNQFCYSQYSDDRLINEGLASNTHVYAILNYIKNTSFNGIYRVMINTPDGQIEDNDSDLARLLLQPNENQNFKEWLDSALTMQVMTGDNFIYGESALGFGDKIMSIETLPSNITEVLISKSECVPVGYRVTFNGKQTTYSLDEVYHGKLYNPTITGLENYRGLSPFQSGYQSLDADNQIFNAKRNFYKNNGVNGILSSGSDIATFTEEEAKQLDNALRGRMGGSKKANSVITTGANVNYTPIGMPSTSMQFLESGDVSLRDLCMLVGLDSKLFGDPKASTYNNVAEVKKAAWNNCIIPFNNRIVSYLNTFVTPTHSMVDGNDYEIIYDTSHVEDLQSDKKTEAEKNKLIFEGINSIVTSSLSEEAKSMMLVKLYDVNEEEAETLIENDEQEQINGGGDQEIEEENNQEEGEEPNNTQES